MTWDDYGKILLALVMWREARGEGTDGMRAVGHVVRNRVMAGWGAWTRVITQPNQFSSMTVPGDRELVAWPVTSGMGTTWRAPTIPVGAIHESPLPDQEFLRALELAERIYAAQDADDPTNGALYYWNPKTGTSDWFQRNVVERYPATAAIGHHIFYGPIKEA